MPRKRWMRFASRCILTSHPNQDVSNPTVQRKAKTLLWIWSHVWAEMHALWSDYYYSKWWMYKFDICKNVQADKEKMKNEQGWARCWGVSFLGLGGHADTIGCVWGWDGWRHVSGWRHTKCCIGPNTPFNVAPENYECLFPQCTMTLWHSDCILTLDGNMWRWEASTSNPKIKRRENECVERHFY